MIIAMPTDSTTAIAPGLAYNRTMNEFLIAWYEYYDYSLRGRRVTGKGDLLFPESANLMDNAVDEPFAVAAIPDNRLNGRYLIASQVFEQGGKRHVKAQLLDFEGQPIQDLDLAVPGSLSRAGLDVAGNENNFEFLVSWVIQPDLREDVTQVVGRATSYQGKFTSEAPSVIGHSAGYPAVTTGEGRDFLVVYEGTTGDDVGIYGRFWGEKGGNGGNWEVYFPLLVK
jgi:hypothetical protein